jgi:hypothetical protein
MFPTDKGDRPICFACFDRIMQRALKAAIALTSAAAAKDPRWQRFLESLGGVR